MEKLTADEFLEKVLADMEGLTDQDRAKLVAASRDADRLSALVTAIRDIACQARPDN